MKRFKNSAVVRRRWREQYSRHVSETNKELLRAKWRKAKWSRRGIAITQEMYDKLLLSQKGVCAICKREPTDQFLNVDHDHLTGAIRGLLCYGCNLGIGHFRNDSLALRLAADYLDRTTET